MVIRIFLMTVIGLFAALTTLTLRPSVRAQENTCLGEDARFEWIPQTDRLLVGSADGFAVYDVNDPDQPLQRFPGIRLRPARTFYRFDQANRLLLTDDHVVDLETGDILGSFPESNALIDLNGDSAVLAGAGVFDVRTGERLLTTLFTAQSNPSFPNMIYSRGQDTVSIYTSLDVSPIVIHSTASDIKMNPDSMRLVLVAPDTGIHLYDLRTGAQIAHLEPLFPVSQSSVFFAEGRYFFTFVASASGTSIWETEYGFRIWDNLTGELLFDAPFSRVLRTVGETVLYQLENQQGNVQGYYLWHNQ